jgi:hypothetical protein
MNIFVRLLEALHRSRRGQAERVIRRYAHLVAEAHEYDRRCAAEKIAATARPFGAIELQSQAS